MSLHGGSVFSRLSKRSAIRDTSQLAVHLSNDNAMRRLLRDGVGINEVQQKYLSLCYSARPAVRPNKDVAQGLAAGELVWNLTVCEKRETSVVASLLTTKEARRELRSLVISANEAGCSSVRMRASMAKRTTRRGSAGLGGGGTREMSMEKDPVGQMELFVALCKALPQLGALRSLELDGLKQAFEKSGAGAARLARGLAGNSKLKSLSVKRIRLVTGAAGATGGAPDNSTRGLGALASAIGGHPSLVALSLGGCGLSGEPSGRLVASVIRAHAARREGMVWSSGLRRPPGVVGHTAAAAPRRISTAGCLAVDLSGNRLGDAGVHAVARGLQSDTWLLGLNLADNGITDRGAALLSVCLQHNATLCALVLDGNPEIGRDAERRITQELETRSTMPEAVLEEPEVVLTLASWGFSAHAGFEGDPPPPPPPDAAGSDSAVSEISQDDFGGGDGLSAVNTPVGRPKTPAERKEEMVREFRRWAGYTPHQPVQVPAPEPAADAGSGPEGMAGRSRARGRSPSTSVLLREEESRYTAAAPPQAAAGRHSTRREVEHQQKGAAGAGDRAHARAHARGRARSLSSRSSRLAPAGSDGGGSSNSIGDGRRSAKRSKSSGPFGRGARGAGAATATATGRARTVRQQVPPWGAGPRNGQVRERMQAWASAHLAVGGSRGSRSGRRRRVRARTVHAGASGFGGVGGGGGRKARRRSAKGTAAGSRRAAKLPDSGVAVPARRERSERARRGPAALDVTWDVLDAQGYPELTPRQRRKLFPASPADADEEDEPAVFSPGVGARGGGNNGGGGGGGGGRTDRVVEMLASLEKAVMDVCKDMWRLEDKVEGSERLTASGGSGQPRECSVATDQASGRREGEGRVASDDLDVGDDGDLDFDGRDEVAAQVEACLREMWDSRAMADRASADGHVSVDDGAAAAAGGADDGTGRNTTAASSGGGDVETAASAGSGAGEDEDEEDNGFRTHAALLLEGGFGGGGGGKCSGRMDSGSGSGTENPAASRRSELPERAAGAGRSHQQVQRDEMKEAEQSLLYGMCAVDEEEEEEGEEKEGKEDQVPGVGVAFEAESSAPGAGAGWHAPTLGDQDRGGGQDRRRGEGAPSEEESVESEEENGGEEADGDGGGANSAARRRRGVGDFVDMAAPPSPSMDDLLFVEDLVGLGEEGGKDGGSEGSEGEDED